MAAGPTWKRHGRSAQAKGLEEEARQPASCPNSQTRAVPSQEIQVYAILCRAHDQAVWQTCTTRRNQKLRMCKTSRPFPPAWEAWGCRWRSERAPRRRLAHAGEQFYKKSGRVDSCVARSCALATNTSATAECCYGAKCWGAPSKGFLRGRGFPPHQHAMQFVLRRHGTRPHADSLATAAALAVARAQGKCGAHGHGCGTAVNNVPVSVLKQPTQMLTP